MTPLSHPDEAQRLAALYGYDILDTPREPDFDDIVNLASEICEAPIAVINFVDRSRQWFKAEKGLGVNETPLDVSICAHAILQPNLFVVPDTLQDPRFASNPLCVGEPHLRFYAGALLESTERFPIGTLCVLDYEPRQLTPFQSRALQVLARQVMAQVELRRALSASSLLLDEIDHRVKNSLQLVSSLLSVHSRSVNSQDVRKHLGAAAERVRVIARLHDQLRHDQASDNVRVGDYLNTAIDGLRQTTPDTIALHLDACDLSLDFQRMSSLGLLVNELVTNAIKHAFPDGRSGNIWVRLAVRDGAATFSVTDDGVPMPELDEGGEKSGSLGMRLSKGLAGALEGELEFAASPGKKTFSVEFPAPEPRSPDGNSRRPEGGRRG